MSTTVEVRELRRLQSCVRQSIVAIVDESVIEQACDDGRKIHHRCPSLLSQLSESIVNNVGGRVNGSGRQRKVPIDVEAFDLYRAIDRAWGISGMTLDSAFRTIPGGAALSMDIGGLGDLARSLAAVADRIRAVLDPPRRAHIAAPCPACHARMTPRPAPYGDVLIPALAVDGTTGCTCLACGHIWPPAQLEHLARVLGLPAVAN